MSEEFARFIETGEIRFKHAKGMRDIFGKEIHVYHEIFFFMGGDADFTTEQGTKRLLPFTAVVIPKNTFHTFTVRGAEQDYMRCVLNFEEVSELDEIIEQKMKGAFLTRDEEISGLFLKMRNLEAAPLTESERRVLLKAFFTELLVCLPVDGKEAPDVRLHAITRQAIEYIGKNMGGDLSVTALSQKLHVSSSYLSHLFKKDLRVPLHKYVLEKRLILTKEKIKNGVPVTVAAEECGFRDYSGFYRQYVKAFGFSPVHGLRGKNKR